jgi:UDP-N-acetylglucosamine:LPS N-acetylglucosamine transferase
MERESDILVCGSERAVEQARALGHGNGRVYQTSGMVIHPKFYERAPIERARERLRLGLDAQSPTGIVLFGGQGSSAMLEIADGVERYPHPLQLIYICGRNQKLKTALTARKTRKLRYIEGFTTDIPYFMQVADFFVGKPGPGSVSEALACGLPVVVVRNAWTLPQERYNAEWIEERQFGIVLRSFAQVNTGISQLLSRYDTMKRAVTTYENRAVFEIPEILQQVLAQAQNSPIAFSDKPASLRANAQS